MILRSVFWPWPPLIFPPITLVSCRNAPVFRTEQFGGVVLHFVFPSVPWFSQLAFSRDCLPQFASGLYWRATFPAHLILLAHMHGTRSVSPYSLCNSSPHLLISRRITLYCSMCTILVFSSPECPAQLQRPPNFISIWVARWRGISAMVTWLSRECVELFFTRPYVLVARCSNTLTSKAFPGFVCTGSMWGLQTVDGTPSCWTYEQFWNVKLQLRVYSVDDILVLTTLENKLSVGLWHRVVWWVVLRRGDLP